MNINFKGIINLKGEVRKLKENSGKKLSSAPHNIVEDELIDDYAKLAGLLSEEDLLEPTFKSIKKRLPWLVVLLFLGMIVSSTIGLFKNTVASLPIIVNFQSLVLAMAGNVGTQSLAVTIRVLMDEDVGGRQKFLLVLKEMRVGLFNGIIIGLISFVLVGGYLSIICGEANSLSFSVSFCTALAMAISMLLSGLFGSLIPIIFKRLKIDPAVASGPLITTVNDLVAVVSFYSLASFLLENFGG